MDKPETLRARFDDYFETYADSIFRHILFKIGDRERAKELTQEVFVRLWQTLLRNEKPIEYPKAFLYTVAHNLYVNEWRDRKSTVSLDTLSESGFEPPSDDEAPFLQYHADEVMQLFQLLPPQYREVLVLRYVDDYEVKEIAELLNESANVISVRIHRALQRCRVLLEQKKNNQ